MRQFCLKSAACFCSSVFLFLGLCLCAHPVLAHKHEVTLWLGGVLSQSRSFHRAGTARSSGDFDLEANYRYLFLHANIAALAPAALISSWVGIGGGYAFYQQSAQFSNGQNTTNKLLNRGILDFGGGVDYALFRFLGPRAEVRDLVSGNPDLNVALSSSTQHNVISSGGMFVRC